MNCAFWQQVKRKIRRSLSPWRPSPYEDGAAWARSELAEKGFFAYEVITRFCDHDHPFARGALDAATEYKAHRAAQGVPSHG